MHGPAKKHVNNSYIYETSFVHASGPTHPNPAKSALFNVSASGTLKMFWGQNNNRWEETPLELESVHSSDDLVTRAAFASERSKSHSLFPDTLILIIARILITCCYYQRQAAQADQDRDQLGRWTI